MPRVVVSVRVGSVISGLKVRRAAAFAAVDAGADAIAKTINSDLIPSVYPGQVAKAVQAFSEPAVEGGRLAAVRLRRMNRLFDFYEKGVKPHVIVGGMNDAASLSFIWELMGQRVFFDHVNHPGYEGRHKLADLRPLVRTLARDEWHRRLAVALGTV